MPDAANPLPYAHWMLREIHEQPSALAATLDRYVAGSALRADTCGPILDWLRAAGDRILVAASGSSRHAGLVGELLLEDRSGIAVDVEYASEYVYRSERAMSSGAVMVLSQSGETADTLAALRKASLAGHSTLAITNVTGSTMATEAGVSFPTVAGAERAVPATKSFTTQLLNLYLLSLMAAHLHAKLTDAALQRALTQVAALPDSIARQLPAWERDVRAIAVELHTAESFLFLGRGVHYAIAREGALKLKESAYRNAEGYPGGELKHGPNALVDASTPLVMIATVDRLDAESVQRYAKTLQLMRDMRRQRATILALANTGDSVVAAEATHTIFVDEASEGLLALCEVIPLQMLAYFMAIQLGLDVDHPRNLTKAVLTE